MIVYSNVLPESEELKSIEVLYNDSFPAVERRKFENVEVLLGRADVPFNMIAAIEDNELLGFLSYWEFDGFRYVEHFAVNEKHRGKGIGSSIMEYFINECDKIPIILEVEIPESGVGARRRVDFYMRHGFIIWRLVKYIQPPYDDGSETVEMSLMTLGVNSNVKVAQMGEILKREVYKRIEDY